MGELGRPTSALAVRTCPKNEPRTPQLTGLLPSFVSSCLSCSEIRSNTSSCPGVLVPADSEESCRLTSSTSLPSVTSVLLAIGASRGREAVQDLLTPLRPRRGTIG